LLHHIFQPRREISSFGFAFDSAISVAIHPGSFAFVLLARGDSMDWSAIVVRLIAAAHDERSPNQSMWIQSDVALVLPFSNLLFVIVVV
jgi:hypothetical protein